MRGLFITVLAIAGLATAQAVWTGGARPALAFCGGATGVLEVGQEADTLFAAPPVATLSPASGLVGANVTVRGSGYPPNAGIQVVFKVGGDPVVATGQSDAAGNVTLTFAVPFALAGRYDVMVGATTVPCYNVVVPFVVIVGSTTPTPVPTATPTSLPPIPTPPLPTAIPATPPPPTVIPATATPTPVPTPAAPVAGQPHDGGAAASGALFTFVLAGLALTGAGGLAMAAASRRSARHS